MVFSTLAEIVSGHVCGDEKPALPRPGALFALVLSVGPPKSVNNVYLESQRICLHPSRPRRLHTNQLEKYCFSGPISIFIDLRRPEARCLLRKSVTAKVSLYWLQLFGSPLSGQR